MVFHISLTAHPPDLKNSPHHKLLHHELDISPWEKKHFLGKKANGVQGENKEVFRGVQKA